MRTTDPLLIPPAAAGHCTRAFAQAHRDGDRTAFCAGAPSDPAERIDFLQHRVTRCIAKRSLNPAQGNRAQSELGRDNARP
jgi:hypothetical protein